MSLVELVVGFGVALMIGLTGVGGGTLTVPILVLFLGTPVAEAVGTALLFSALVKIPAALLYLWQRRVDFGVLKSMLLGGVPGVVLGAVLLGRFQEGRMRDVVLIVVGLTIGATAAFNLWRLVRGNGERGTVPHPRFLPWLTLVIGVEVGFSSAGAGALGTLILLGCTTLAPAVVVGTDLAFGLTLSAVGGGLHLGLGHWSPTLLQALVLGGVPGAVLGARLATVLPARSLRAALLVWLVVLGGQLLQRGAAALFQ